MPLGRHQDGIAVVAAGVGPYTTLVPAPPDPPSIGALGPVLTAIAFCPAAIMANGPETDSPGHRM
jgi:hypothetical protein